VMVSIPPASCSKDSLNPNIKKGVASYPFQLYLPYLTELVWA